MMRTATIQIAIMLVINIVWITLYLAQVREVEELRLAPARVGPPVTSDVE